MDRRIQLRIAGTIEGQIPPRQRQGSAVAQRLQKKLVDTFLKLDAGGQRKFQKEFQDVEGVIENFGVSCHFEAHGT
jgi:hypothetical protein